MDGNSFDHEYGSNEIQRRGLADRSASSNRATALAELAKMGDPRSSHDVSVTKATSGGNQVGASAMDLGRYRKLLSSSVQLENKARQSRSRENEGMSASRLARERNS